VADTANTVAKTYNGAGTVTCEIISSYSPATPAPGYTVIDPNCADTAGWASNPNADGVYILAGTTEQTTFGKAATKPVTSLTQNRPAAATIQTLTGIGSGFATFLVCATNQTDVNTSASVPPLLIWDPSAPTGYDINPAAIYKNGAPVMELHGPQIDGCGAGTAFKGDGSTLGQLPAWLPGTTGTHAGPTRVAVAGYPGCDAASLASDPTGCVLVLPICTAGTGNGSAAQLYCVMWGAFELVGAGANTDDFGFLGGGTASSGQTGGGKPSGNGLNVIQLVQ
jgi:hypothetical protein